MQAVQRTQAALESQRQELQREIQKLERDEATEWELDKEGTEPTKKDPCVDGTACEVSDAKHALPL